MDMRSLLLTLMAIVIASPVFAGTAICRMDGPHNCAQENEIQLVDITKSTIHQMQLTHPEHAFKTQNDVILEAYAQSKAQLGGSQGQAYILPLK